VDGWVCMYVFRYVCMYVCIYVCLYLHVYLYIYVYINIYICIYNIYVCIYLPWHIYSYVYAHIYTHIHTHTYTHTLPFTHTYTRPAVHCKCTNRCLPLIPLPPLSPSMKPTHSLLTLSLHRLPPLNIHTHGNRRRIFWSNVERYGAWIWKNATFQSQFARCRWLGILKFLGDTSKEMMHGYKRCDVSIVFYARRVILKIGIFASHVKRYGAWVRNMQRLNRSLREAGDWEIWDFLE